MSNDNTVYNNDQDTQIINQANAINTQQSNAINTQQSNAINTFNIYILKCTNNKYYIGKTKLDVEKRYNQHLYDKSCVFTTKYPPIEIITTYKTDDSLEENNMTKKYMILYGIENVRGGSYANLELEEWQIKSLEMEFKSAGDYCYKCGEINHFAKNCNELDITEYVNKYKSVDEITIEIDNLENILHNIEKLEGIIKELSFISKEDISIIKQVTITNCQVINLMEQLKLAGFDKRTQIQNQINEIYMNNPETKNAQTHNGKMQNINIIFTKYFPELRNKFVYYYDIQAYKILNMKIDKMIELNKIKSIYKSNEIVKQILLELYNKKFTILEKQYLNEKQNISFAQLKEIYRL
jgi:predicted GIY-YIG superfamily endonuclease